MWSGAAGNLHIHYYYYYYYVVVVVAAVSCHKPFLRCTSPPVKATLPTAQASRFKLKYFLDILCDVTW